jgi:osmotically-inducible protein OsmY
MSIPGVRAVKNFLRITHPEITLVPGDDEIKKSIESVLKWNSYIEEAELDIIVEEGIVSLKGTVDLPWKKERIEQMAYNIFGVVEVINQLGVVPTKNIVDQVIAEDIAAAFERNANIDSDVIDVKVEDGNVVLSGTLPNWNAFRAAYEIALHTAGVVSVVNDLSVGQP